MNKTTLQKNLKSRLKNVKRLVILGIGSELKSDDGAGMLAAQHIQSALQKKHHSIPVKAIFGSTAPENFTGEIIKFKADHVIMLDCADIHKKPGTVEIIDAKDIAGISFSTHMLPIDIMADYLFQSSQCACTIIGIQPKSIDYGSIVSPQVAKAVKTLASAILSAIR